MASQEHWNVSDEREMWLKVVGHESEDEAETESQAARIFDGIPNGLLCLEIGAGVGRLLKHARKHFHAAVGVDSSPSIVQMAKQDDFRIFVTDGINLPYENDTFDFVYSFTCFQHMPIAEMVRLNLREAFRVLIPGGTCRIQTVQGEPDPNLYDGYVFPTPKAFAYEFRRVGFEIDKAEAVDNWIWVTASK